MNCKYCGSDIVSLRLNCSQCGAPIHSAIRIDQVSRENKNSNAGRTYWGTRPNLLMALLGVLLFFTVTGLCFISLAGTDLTTYRIPLILPVALLIAAVFFASLGNAKE